MVGNQLFECLVGVGSVHFIDPFREFRQTLLEALRRQLIHESLELPDLLLELRVSESRGLQVPVQFGHFHFEGVDSREQLCLGLQGLAYFLLLVEVQTVFCFVSGVPALRIEPARELPFERLCLGRALLRPIRQLLDTACSVI